MAFSTDEVGELVHHFRKAQYAGSSNAAKAAARAYATIHEPGGGDARDQLAFEAACELANWATRGADVARAANDWLGVS